MKGLFEKGSIDNEAMKSRDKKRMMFVKIITLIEIVSKKDLGIDVDKILAGQESEKTNLMLQVIGRLAGKPEVVAQNSKMVKATLKKLAADSPSETKVDKKEASRDAKKSSSKESSKKKVEKVAAKEAVQEEAEAPQPAEPVEPAPKPKQRRPPSANASRRREAMKSQAHVESDEVEIDDGEPDERGMGNDASPTDEEGRPMTSRGARPVTAGRGNSMNDPYLVQTRIMDDEAGTGGEPDSIRIVDADNEAMVTEGEHGALVQQMLKVRDEAGAKRSGALVDDDQPLKLNSQQMKEFERRRQDLIKTQETIQELSRAILPLAKAADYAQEDTDQMSKEHVQWRNQVTASKQQLRHVYQRTVVKTNDRMKAKVSQLEQEVEHKKAQIRAQYYQNMLLEKRLNALTTSILS